MKAPVPKARPSKTMVDSFKKSNVSANKNKKAGIDGAMGDNKKPKTFKSSNSKLDSKGNYKGSNIKPTKLQLERMKKRRARANFYVSMSPPNKRKVTKRNYRKEYENYHSKPEQIKRRDKRNAANAIAKKKGIVKKGDGKDVAHRNGNP